ncbi:hypothetical protein NUH86_09955 [Sphingobium sp. JS3065]|uniref:hypothetical protein n=1 Tax=Sphingobium sp. JS3065 TaxID=2970925 RepID=UPI0022651BBC|nr:hypothetical protein [Sphingobium sp. JS3065]UZW53874.1 hypothetical protein NUH86_09955 [Sphingobium sp. JS3065]
MNKILLMAAPALLLFLPGCIARTAAKIVTAPVRAGSQVVDWSTTSQEEADRNYGRNMRKQEAREARERKKEEERRRRECRDAGYDNCR